MECKRYRTLRSLKFYIVGGKYYFDKGAVLSTNLKNAFVSSQNSQKRGDPLKEAQMVT